MYRLGNAATRFPGWAPECRLRLPKKIEPGGTGSDEFRFGWVELEVTEITVRRGD